MLRASLLVMLLGLATGASATLAAPRELAAALLALPPAPTWSIVARVPLDFRTHHPQGLVKRGDRFYLTAVETRLGTLRGRGWLFEFDAAGHLTGSRMLASGGVFHPGGLDFDGTNLWTAVSAYRPDSRARVLRIDPATLVPTPVFEFGDHLGTVVHDTERHTVHASSWGSRTFYTFDEAGAVLAKDANPSGLVELQDCKFLGDGLMLGTGLKSSVGAVQVFHLRPDELRASARLDLKSDRGQLLTRNPVAAELANGRLRLYCVPDDDRSTMYVVEPR